jgi:hypothetical protein
LSRELHEFAGEKHEHVWLGETEQHIPLVNAMAPQNFREIAELLSNGTKLKPTNADRARVVQRGLEKKAPFSAEKNSVADALLIEMTETRRPTHYERVTVRWSRGRGPRLRRCLCGTAGGDHWLLTAVRGHLGGTRRRQWVVSMLGPALTWLILPLPSPAVPGLPGRQGGSSIRGRNRQIPGRPDKSS